MQALFELDRNIFLTVNHINGGALDYIFAWPTYLGENLICLALVTAYLRIWDSKDFKRNAVFYAYVVLVTGLIVHVTKTVISRERPYQYFFEDFVTNQIALNFIFKMPTSHSFPSGHSALAFATVWTLNRLYGNRLMFLYFLAAVIAFSRIYVGAHFPLDVLGGALLGIFSGGLCLALRRIPFSRRFGFS